MLDQIETGITVERAFRTPRFDYMDPGSSAVQDFIWKYLVASDFYYKFSKFEAMKVILDMLSSRQSSLYGDLSLDVAIRCDFSAPRLVNPHFMGNAHYLRGIIKVFHPSIFAMGMDYIHVMTHNDAIARILLAYGYTNIGSMPSMSYVPASNTYLPVHMLYLSRDQFYGGQK